MVLGQCFVSFRYPVSTIVVVSIYEQHCVLMHVTDETKRRSRSEFNSRIRGIKLITRDHVSIDWMWLRCNQRSLHTKRPYIVNSLKKRNKDAENDEDGDDDKTLAYRHVVNQA